MILGIRTDQQSWNNSTVASYSTVVIYSPKNIYDSFSDLIMNIICQYTVTRKTLLTSISCYQLQFFTFHVVVVAAENLPGKEEKESCWVDTPWPDKNPNPNLFWLHRPDCCEHIFFNFFFLLCIFYNAKHM